MGYKRLARKRKITALVPYGSRAIVPVKRRRTIVRRRYYRSRGNSRSFTTANQPARNAIIPRGRKLSKRAWRALLWRDTMMKQKYRSAFSININDVVTPTNHRLQGWAIISVLEKDTPFWTTGGGLMAVNYGTTGTFTPPTLSPNTVVIRGGYATLRMSLNPTLPNPVNLRCQLVFPKQQSDTARDAVGTSANNPLVQYVTDLQTNFSLTTTPYTWRVQDAPDYDQYFYRPIMDKQVELLPGNSIEYTHRLRVRKVDCDSFSRGLAGYPYWIIYYGETNNSDAVASTIELTQGYNLSFCVVDL